MNKGDQTSTEKADRLELAPPRLRVAADFILYQSGVLSVVITTLFVWPLLGRVLSKNLLGEVSLHLAIASILAPALSLGAHLYLANRLASRVELGIAIEAKTAITLTIVLYSMSILSLASSYLLEISGGLLVSFGLSCAISAYLVTSGVMRGINMPRSFAFFVFLVQVIGLAGLGIATVMGQDFRSGLSVYILLIGFPVLAQYVMLREHSVAVSRASVLRALGTSARLVPHVVLAVALLMMMRVLVSVRLGNQEAANYTFASLIIGGSLTIGASLDAHWSVRAQGSKSIKRLSSVLSRNQTKIQVMLLLASAGVVLFLSVFLDSWLPSGYDSNGVRVAVLCALPGASLQAIADGRAAVLMWMNRPILVSIPTALGTFLTVLLAYLLLPDYGWPVVGIVLTIGLAFRALLTTLATRLVCPQSRIGLRNLVIFLMQLIFASALFATT